MQAARWKDVQAELQVLQAALARRDADVARLQQQLAQQGAPLLIRSCRMLRLCIGSLQRGLLVPACRFLTLVAAATKAAMLWIAR